MRIDDNPTQLRAETCYALKHSNPIRNFRLSPFLSDENSNILSRSWKVGRIKAKNKKIDSNLLKLLHHLALLKCLKDIKKAKKERNEMGVISKQTFHKTFVIFSEEFLRKKFLLKRCRKEISFAKIRAIKKTFTINLLQWCTRRLIVVYSCNGWISAICILKETPALIAWLSA